MILLPARGFLAVEVEDNVIHLLADSGIVGQHLVAEACGGAIRKLLPHTLEKCFGIGKLLCISIGIGNAAHQRLVPRHVLPLDIEIIGRTVAVIIARRRIAAQAVAVMLQLDEAEYDLIKFPQRGVCLYKCGNERYLLEVHAPAYKEKLFGTAGGR